MLSAEERGFDSLCFAEYSHIPASRKSLARRRRPAEQERAEDHGEFVNFDATFACLAHCRSWISVPRSRTIRGGIASALILALRDRKMEERI